MQVYADAVQKGVVSENTPLSYREVAKIVRPILNYYQEKNNIPELTIGAGGFLTITEEALQKDKVFEF